MALSFPMTVDNAPKPVMEVCGEGVCVSSKLGALGQGPDYLVLVTTLVPNLAAEAELSCSDQS